jgi:cholest-4-en-3-one 26-monooxygenase
MTLNAAGVPEIDVSAINLLDFDRLTGDELHSWFEHLRRHAPIAHHPEPDGPGFYVFSRHADVVAIGKDAAHFSSDVPGGNITGLMEPSPEQTALLEGSGGGQSMICMDPPQHTRYRRLVNRGFTPMMIRQLEQTIEELAARVVSDALEKRDVDFVDDIAAQIPLAVIADLMGIPAEDRAKVFHWTNRIIGQEDPEFNPGYETSFDETLRAVIEFRSYSKHLGDLARENPRDDILTKLLSADIDGDRLSEADFERFFELLVLAGNETTRTTMAQGMRAFLEHPDQWERLVADPTLIDSAAEEILRYTSPVMFMRRDVTEDLEYGGVRFRAGDKVSLWYVSANRDEDVFDDPFVFDIGRSPNPHVAFGGGGPHHCLGAHLARLEIRVVFAELIKSVGSIERLGPPDYLRSNFLRAIKHLPVRLEPPSL